MKRLSSVLVLAGILAAFSTLCQTANAVTLNFQTTSQTLTGLGLDPNYPNSDYDHMILGGQTGSVTLNPGDTVLADINSLRFETGYNRYSAAGPFSYSILRDMTVGAQTLSLAQPLDVLIGASDTFHVLDGNPVVFNVSPGLNLEVTPLGRPAITVADNWQGTLQAQFRLIQQPTAPASVPEPGVLQFSAVLGLFGLGLLKLRRTR
jgi:hypothetical protein